VWCTKVVDPYLPGLLPERFKALILRMLFLEPSQAAYFTQVSRSRSLAPRHTHLFLTSGAEGLLPFMFRFLGTNGLGCASGITHRRLLCLLRLPATRCFSVRPQRLRDGPSCS
jgi:hypothetical protein